MQVLLQSPTPHGSSPGYYILHTHLNGPSCQNLAFRDLHWPVKAPVISASAATTNPEIPAFQRPEPSVSPVAGDILPEGNNVKRTEANPRPLFLRPGSLRLMDTNGKVPVTCPASRADHVPSLTKGAVGAGKAFSNGLLKRRSMLVIFTVLPWNCRDLRDNREQLKLLIKRFQPKCVCLQETMVGPSNPPPPAGYQVFYSRHDPAQGHHVPFLFLSLKAYLITLMMLTLL